MCVCVCVCAWAMHHDTHTQTHTEKPICIQTHTQKHTHTCASVCIVLFVFFFKISSEAFHSQPHSLWSDSMATSASSSPSSFFSFHPVSLSSQHPSVFPIIRPSAKHHNSTHPVSSPTVSSPPLCLPRSILLRPIKSYHEANCLFDQLSVDQEVEAFSPVSVRGETDEPTGDIWVCGNNMPQVCRRVSTICKTLVYQEFKGRWNLFWVSPEFKMLCQLDFWFIGVDLSRNKYLLCNFASRKVKQGEGSGKIFWFEDEG